MASTPPVDGQPGVDLAEHAVNAAAHELVKAAGRPEGFAALCSEYEMDAWRHATRRVIRTYLDHLPFPP